MRVFTTSLWKTEGGGGGGREKEENNEKANGFPTGQSVPEPHNKMRGPTREQPLADLWIHLLTRLWRRFCRFSTYVK